MKYTKYVAIFIVSLFLLSAILPCTVAQSDNDRLDRFKIFEFIFRYSMRGGVTKLKLGGIIFNPFKTPWMPMVFSEPESFNAVPNSISTQYLNKTEIIIGVKNLSTGNYKTMDYERGMKDLIPVEDYEFKLEIPDYVPEGVFVSWFDPPLLVWDAESKEEMKTKLIISTNIPKDVDLPKEIVLRVNITKYLTAGNLFWQAGRPTPFRPLKWPWMLSARFGPHPFGKIYGGKRLPEPSMYLDIVVHLDRFHLAEIAPPLITEIKPDQLVSVPIQIQNLGSHLDTFNFRVSTNDGSELVIAAPSSISLEPGEIGFTSIGVASPRIFNDPGTSHSIKIEAFSIYDKDKIFGNTAVIITRGVYLSQLNQIFSAIIAILVLFGVAIIYFRRQKILEKICKKPEKPWNIPIERKHLEELKRKDKEAYEKERLLMEDEYKSAMLWYKDYLESVKKERNQKSKEKNEKTLKKQKDKTENAITKFFSKTEKKKEKKQPKKEKKPEKKVEKPKEKKEEKPKETPEIVKEQYKAIQKRSIESDRRKQTALEKIKRAQEKQKRKTK